MSVTRRNFIKISSGTFAALAIGLDGCTSNKVCVTGHVYDLFGFPVQRASVDFVTGYSLKADDGLKVSGIIRGPVITDALGAFEICFDNPHGDLALRVIFQNEVQQITVKQITGTNIPFYNAEVWSSDSTKWINDLNNQGLLNNINVFIDSSRLNMQKYFARKYPALMFALQNNQSHAQDDDNNESEWEGDHVDPDNPSNCLGDACDDHYDYPQVLDRSRKINPPWGSERGVIPFVCGEGVAYNLKTGEDDGDDDWDTILEPQYGYLPNSDNAKNIPKSMPGRDFSMHFEMCKWFQGKTNISRNNNLQAFANKRVWMTGSWTVDNGHHDGWGRTDDYHNEFHPVYWFVNFIGGWRRFVASEVIRISGPSSGAQTIINSELNTNPQSLLNMLGSMFGLALLQNNLEDHSAAEAFYIDAIVHLNKYGLNSTFPNIADSAANSINRADFQQEANTLSTDQMTANVKKRYQIIFDHLTSLGSGVFVFPCMIFIHEGTDIIQQADANGLTRPSSLLTVFDPFIQVSLGKEVLLFADSIVENAPTLLKLAYQDIFNKMKNDEKISASQIADYYAKTSVRLISYGMYADTDLQHSRFYSDHFNWALPRAKTDTIELINSINVRVDDLFRDAFPFSRTV